MQRHQWFGAQIQNQIKRFCDFDRVTIEINGPRDLTNGYAVPVGATFIAIYLVAKINRTFRANSDTGVAAGTQVQINRITFCPTGFKGTQPSF